jgi:hypothetical protein
MAGECENIGDWIHKNIHIGFYWQNRGGQPMTRTFIRIEFLGCQMSEGEPVSWRGSDAKYLGFEDPWGSIPFKNYCINSACACATAATLVPWDMETYRKDEEDEEKELPYPFHDRTGHPDSYSFDVPGLGPIFTNMGI